jgi:methionine-rich copper-binding protein CopC
VVSISAAAYELNAGSAVQTPAGPVRAVVTARDITARLTTPDVLAPTPVSFSPARNALNVSAKAKLAINFSEKITKGTGFVYLKDTNGNVIESFDMATSARLTVSGSKLLIDPTDALLDASTRYEVSLDAGVVKDLAGNGTAANSGYAFTTAADRTAPKITDFSPAVKGKDVALDANITFTFSEKVKFGGGAILLKDADGEVVESFDVETSKNIALSEDGKTLVINPAKDLASNVTYSVVMAKGTIQDRYNNNFSGSMSSFTTVRTGFNIDLAYGGPAVYKKYFNQAKAILEKVITADLPEVNGVDDLKITASVATIDGVGRILGQASPTVLRGDSRLPVQGAMKFDTVDMASMAANGSLGRVILHEMTHVLGVGPLWNTFGLNSIFGRYTGANGVKAYQEMTGDNSRTYVPLETSGGSGTVNAHWSEATFQSELMTGIAGGGMELSKLTVAALSDLGYAVDVNRADAYTLPA